MTEKERIERLEEISEYFYVYLRGIYKALYSEACDRMEFLQEKEKFDLIEKGYRNFKQMGDENFHLLEEQLKERDRQ